MDLKNKDQETVSVEKSKALKQHHQRRRLMVGDADFVPPDGKWGWLIVFACGFSNLSTFPMFQQFGLVFREKFEYLGITNTQTTTVINLNSAFNACVGLLNGPVFRSFTYRQVAMFGSCLVLISLFLTTFCQSFWTYIIFYAMCYGSGIGITQSSNALALNTYFKKRRRIATGLSWSTTALGPIVWPYIITYLLDIYGMEGTLMIFAAFAGHAFMCSLLLQPVEWHTQFRDPDAIMDPESKQFLIATPRLQPKPSTKSQSLLSSQYHLVFNSLEEDDANAITGGYEIIGPGTPMMAKANDGWYSRNRSLAGSMTRLEDALVMSKRSSYNNLAETKSKRNSSVNLVQDGAAAGSIKATKREKKLSQQPQQNEASIREEDVEIDHEQNLSSVVYPNEKDVLKIAAKKLEVYKKETENENETEDKTYTFFEKVYIFFDFDLFKDPVYVNLMLGITIANFAELNFSILTPMVLTEFNFKNYEIATFMSLLGATDIVVRFFVPFIAEKIGWDNKTFFLVGVLSMAFGRIILVHTQTYSISLLVAVIIGAGKGLRTIFMALVIPSHVSLERLPAASGLQLATSGLLFLAMGPVVGWVRDMVNNYVITLHVLNIMTYITAVAWTVEMFLSKRMKLRQRNESK